MVGIVLASHGGFADGIAQSAQMLFGEQDNLAHVILKPDEGPDDIRGKMEKAIASFDNQDEVLFLVDLWGGTPFNQANGLAEKHDKWAIVAGMNLPMVVQALTERMMDANATAKHIATAVVQPGRDGIKTKPADLMPKTAAAAPVADKAAAKGSKKSITEGTVIGDGHIKYVLARIDSRLLHGQVATGWIPAMKPDRVIVVSDSVAKDDLRKSMIREAAPAGVKAHTVPLKNLKNINVGSMSYKEGDVNANNVLSMNQKDVDTFRELEKMGVKFDVRKVPSDAPGNMDAILKKAQTLLDEKK